MKTLRNLIFLVGIFASSIRAELRIVHFNMSPYPSRHSPYHEYADEPVYIIKSFDDIRSIDPSNSLEPHVYASPIGFYKVDEKIYFIESRETIQEILTNTQDLVVGTKLLASPTHKEKETQFSEDEFNSLVYETTDSLSVARKQAFITQKRFQLAKKCVELKRQQEEKASLEPYKRTANDWVNYAPAIISNMHNLEQLRQKTNEYAALLATRKAISKMKDIHTEAAASTDAIDTRRS